MASSHPSNLTSSPLDQGHSDKLIHKLILTHGHSNLTPRSTTRGDSSSSRGSDHTSLGDQPGHSGTSSPSEGTRRHAPTSHRTGAENLGAENLGAENLGFDTSELPLHPGLLGHHDEDETAYGESLNDEKVIIERPIYTQREFDEGHEEVLHGKHRVSRFIRSRVSKCECSFACVRRSVAHRLPFLAIMRDYNFKTDLIADAIAGLTVGIMHIPQGMAYSQLATLPPVYGLYASFFPVILYFFFGTSKHISLGTFAVISLMTGSTITKGIKARNLVPTTFNRSVEVGGNVTFELSNNSEEILHTKLMLAMSVTFIVGVIQLLLGVLRLGFITVYLSDALISGFTTGAAVHVFISQISSIFGISTGKYSGVLKLVYECRDIFQNLPQSNVVTFIAALICMLLLWIVKEYINGNTKVKAKLKMPIPIELIVVVMGTVVSYLVKLEEKYKVKVVGEVPVGIPPPNLNPFSCLSEVVSDAIAIAIVSFAISVSMAKIFANKHDYFVDANQELLAYGICNIVPSFFSSFVSTVSMSRSLVQEEVGGKTQVTGLVSSVLLLVVLLVIGTYFRTLPNCVLAAIIMVSLKGMFRQFLQLKTLWKISLVDFATWIVVFLGTVLLDVDLGLLVGVMFALLTVILKSQRPHSCVMGQVPGTDLYKNISVYPSAKEIPNIKIFRFDSAIFFANSEFFKTSLYKHTVDPYDLKKLRRKLKRHRKKEHVYITESSNSELQSGETGHRTNDIHLTIGHPADHHCMRTSTEPSRYKQATALSDIVYIIIDCSMMSYIDAMGVKVLQQVG
ncbi:prestin-like [Physella acuta]|uniref:prestin-like n=1 Tax=Physella acuta TaxID=109671 RepID=UPI0027DE829F|nr:prestin-like [Physella acuta]